MKKVALGLLITGMVAGCSDPKNEEATSSAIPPFYKVTFEVDPITDEEIVKAEASLDSEDRQNTSSIAWICRRSRKDEAKGTLTLSFSSFQPADISGKQEGAPFDSQNTGVYMQGINIPTKVVKLRVDGGEPLTARCALIELDVISAAIHGVQKCDFGNQVSIDLNRSDIGLRRGPDGKMALGDQQELVYQYAVSGNTFSYRAPIDTEVAKVVNACPVPQVIREEQSGLSEEDSQFSSSSE